MDPLFVVLRLLHIGAGVLWVGAAWMLFFFVTPTLNALGPETERAFTTYVLRQRRLGHVILIATLLTVGAGAILLVIDISRFGLELWFSTGFGIGITIGALAAIVSFLLGPLAIIPISNRLAEMGAQVDENATPPTDAQRLERERLSRRLRTMLAWDSMFLIVAVVLMAIARYL